MREPKGSCAHSSRHDVDVHADAAYDVAADGVIVAGAAAVGQTDASPDPCHSPTPKRSTGQAPHP